MNDPYLLGDTCLCWSFGDTISREINTEVLKRQSVLKDDPQLRSLGVTDVVPSYTELAIYFSDPAAADEIIQTISDLSSDPVTETINSTEHSISVVYQGQDLERVSSLTDLSTEEIVTLHTSSLYQVAMIGFLPLFPYLLGLNKQLQVPRLDSPRKKVPAGSVAIAGEQAGVYPTESPGGWNIIGSCDPNCLKELSPGDKVKFVGE